MWKIHRYYFKEVLTDSVLAFVVLFGIALISLIYRGIQRAQGGDLVDAAFVTLLWAADTFPHLLAISLLFGTVLTFARASADRELTAIRGAGISSRVPMAAALLVGMLFSVVAAYTLHYVIPWTHYYKFRVVEDVTRNLVLNTRPEGDTIHIPGRGDMTWRSEDQRGHFHDVVLHLPKGESGRRSDIGNLLTASEAWFEMDAKHNDLGLELEDVRDPISGGYQKHLAIWLDLHEITDEGYRHESDKDLPSDQLLAEVYRGVHENPDGAYYTIYYRASFALLPLLFAPIGFCIGVLARDRGRATALALAMGPLLIFYFGHFLGPEMARALNTPIMAWFPDMLLVALGTPFCWRQIRY